MHNLEGKTFFDDIRRSVKISYFVASVIPLALLVYFSIKYVYPYITHGDISKVPVNIGILLVLAVVVSVLGLLLSTKATDSSIASAQELNKKINSLFAITKQFRETIYPDVLLQKIVESAMELTAAGSGTLLLYDEQGHLRFKVTAGKDFEKINFKSLKSDDGIAGWVAETGKPAMINDASKDNRYNPEFDHETGIKTVSVLCVPLISSNETIGVLELRNNRRGEFTAQDEALLHSLADQASISIVQHGIKERQHMDFIQITEVLVSAQDYMQNRKGHVRKVANYANLIGKQMEFSEAELKRLYHAALLHDIGMLKIGASEQWDKDKIMLHPKLGHDLLKPISLWSGSADIVLCHHEKYDGTGYPLSKGKDDIPLAARILAVADTFDVLTSSYSFKKQLDCEAAVKEIETYSGTQFDPLVVEALKSAVSSDEIIKRINQSTKPE
ncbi:MAG: GAF domain-containing protein [Nitrospirae bacterium]|nr:GAF domain-containing protein [Nitrospirota bacterium]